MSPSRRRILILAEWYFPHQGGSEQVGHQAALALTQAGHEVTVHTPAFPGDAAFDAAQPYRIVRSALWARTRLWEVRGGLPNRIGRLVAAALIFFRAAFSPWDALLCVHLPILALPGKLLRMMGRRRIYAWALGEEISIGEKSAAMRRQLAMALNNARGIIAISSDTADAVRAFGIPKERIILQFPTPAAAFFEPLNAEAAAAARQRHADRDTMLLVTVARLVERKGIDTTLRALAGLRGTVSRKFVYIVAGTGPCEQSLRALASELKLNDVVKFIGGCNEEEKLPLMEAADLFLTPNRQLPSGEKEGFGIVFVEAALRGTPSIAGRSGGTSDAVSEDVSGWLVDAQDHRQLEEMLRVLMADPDRLSRMRSGARDWAMSLFPSHRDHLPLIELLEER